MLIHKIFKRTMATTTTRTKNIVIDPFCFRQFTKNSGKIFIDYDQTSFENKINELYDEKLLQI